MTINVEICTKEDELDIQPLASAQKLSVLNIVNGIIAEERNETDFKLNIRKQTTSKHKLTDTS